jgi:hypothetical protein
MRTRSVRSYLCNESRVAIHREVSPGRSGLGVYTGQTSGDKKSMRTRLMTYSRSRGLRTRTATPAAPRPSVRTYKTPDTRVQHRSTVIFTRYMQQYPFLHATNRKTQNTRAHTFLNFIHANELTAPLAHICIHHENKILSTNKLKPLFGLFR